MDAILEDIRLGLEINHPKFNQRRVSCIKFLGELYNYQQVESNVVFRVLYLLISFGWNVDGERGVRERGEREGWGGGGGIGREFSSVDYPMYMYMYIG